MFNRNREPLGNATNMPAAAAPVDPAYGNQDMGMTTGGKRRSGLFNRNNRNTLTKPAPGAGYANGMGANNGYAAGGQPGLAGPGAGPQVDPSTGVPIPPSHALGPSTTPQSHPLTPTASSARSLRNSGRLDTFLGSLFCAPGLKAKGIAKEQQAHAMSVQAAELGAAGRLEEEAARRRERAVQHGAHPALGALGGAGAGGMANDTGAGAGGVGAAGGMGANETGANDTGMGGNGGMGAPNSGMGAAGGGDPMYAGAHNSGMGGGAAGGDPMSYADGGAPNSGLGAPMQNAGGVDPGYNGAGAQGDGYGPVGGRIGLNA